MVGIWRYGWWYPHSTLKYERLVAVFGINAIVTISFLPRRAAAEHHPKKGAKTIDQSVILAYTGSRWCNCM